MKRGTEMVTQIRRRWLEEHLGEVEALITGWLGQTNLGNPFYPPRDEGEWKEVYQSPIERDREQNHILRRHLRYRTLWGHHTRWQQLLPAFTELRKETLREAKRITEGKGQYWVLTALWQAWERANNEPKSEDEERDWEKRISSYYRPDSPPSPAVMFGGFAIGEKGEVKQVRAPHLEMIRRLARLDSLKEALGVWSEIEDTGEKMREIGRRIVKSHDILYPCQYCRHLWK